MGPTMISMRSLRANWVLVTWLASDVRLGSLWELGPKSAPGQSTGRGRNQAGTGQKLPGRAVDAQGPTSPGQAWPSEGKLSLWNLTHFLVRTGNNTFVQWRGLRERSLPVDPRTNSQQAPKVCNNHTLLTFPRKGLLWKLWGSQVLRQEPPYMVPCNKPLSTRPCQETFLYSDSAVLVLFGLAASGTQSYCR